MKLKEDFKEFFELLNAAGVKYVIAGAYASRLQVTVDGVVLNFLSKPLLLRNKRAVGRPQDIADAVRLEDLDK